MTLNAHKFILCARIEVLKKPVMFEMAKEGFDGTLKIPQVSVKLMLAILH